MHFIITFGFAIPRRSVVKGDQFEDKGKVKTKRQKQQDKNKIKDMSQTISSPNIINVGQVLAEIHVEYEFLPNYTFKFDCRCWETATKIYTVKSDWSLRPILCPIKDVLWTVFSVHHLVQLSAIQLLDFFNHVITYRVFYGKKRFSEKAKKDKVKGFYMNDSSINIEPHDFLEIYSLDSSNLNPVRKSSTLTLPEPITVTNETYGDFNIITYLEMIPDKAHEYKFRKMMKKDRFPPECFEVESLEVEEKLISKKDSRNKRFGKSKQSKRKQETELTYNLQLPAGTLFSDMGSTTRFKRTPQLPSVSSTLICTECRNMFKDTESRMNLNSIAIKLEQLSNFPADMIIEHGFNYVYVKIRFLNHTIITPYYIPSSTMCFEFIKCFLCKELHPEVLISFLATKLVFVEIIGERSINAVDPAMMKEEVLLGIAKFDISDLLRGYWELRLISSLSHPCNIDFTCINNSNDEEIRISWKHSPLTNPILTSFGTSVKIKVRLTYSLGKIQRKIFRQSNTLNRIFLKAIDAKLANRILEDVSAHNFSLLKERLSNNEKSMEQTINNDVLTGFVIDCCETYYIFLEGLSKGHLLTIWKMVANLPFRSKCVYYNSSYVFLTRLYEDFIRFGGMVHLKLSDPLEIQLRKHSLYVGETKTTVQANVMKKIALMKLASTMKSLCQACLFPESRIVESFLDGIHEIQIEHFRQTIAN